MRRNCLLLRQYNITVTNVSVANMNSTLVNALSVTLKDSAVNLLAGLDSVQSQSGYVTDIKLTDIGAPAIKINATQFSNDYSSLGLISSNYRLSIQGSIAANLAGKLGNSHWAAVSVADSAANIVKNLDALQAHTANISGISLTDTGTPNLKLTVASVSSDLSVLNNIQSNYLLSVNDSASTINKLDLSGLHTSSIEFLPTNLIVGGTVQENTQVTNLNLSLIIDQSERQYYQRKGL